MPAKILFRLSFTGLIGLFMVMGLTVVNADPILKKTAFNNLSTWDKVDKTASYQAFKRSCDQMAVDNRAFSKNPRYGGTYDDWRPICLNLQNLGERPSKGSITSFFETHFTPLMVNDPTLKNGLFTGYFEPVVKGSLARTDRYNVAVYKRPDDLVTFTEIQEQKTGLRYGRLLDGQPTQYFTRKEIEQGELVGKNLELVWLENRADAFFMQIQGSGRVELPGGKTIKLAYAGKTGLPYTAIGGELIKSGEIKKSAMSMQSIRRWMDENPEKSQSLMWLNKSFVFFRQLENNNPHLGPVGAQHVHLTPNVSLAIDRRYWALGTPIWLDTNVVLEQHQQPKPWRSLMVAQDTGSAIRGYARGDVFWGSGKNAGVIAGQMKSAGKMVVLLPTKLVDRLVN